MDDLGPPPFDDEASKPSTDPADPVVVGLRQAIDPPNRSVTAARRVGAAFSRLGDWGIESWVTLGIVATCVVFTFTQLSPSDIFSSSTPAGGDMGAHVWGPAYMRDHLLPSFRLTGWTPDWYAGFPAYHFYMVFPSLAIAILSFVLPYGIAFKLVAISGLLTLPIACWLFARLVRLPFPAPPLFAVAGTAFLFDRSFSIYGGNIASTMAGEFAFSISLSFAIVFLGVVGRGLESGKHRALAAGLLALTGLCHLIPFLFAIAGSVVWLGISAARRSGFRTRVWWLLSAGLVGVGLTAWWLVPFYLRSGYMNDMGWEKKTTYVDLLFQRKYLDPQLVNSPPIEWVLVLALLGVLMSIAWKRRGGAFLVGLAILAAIAFRFIPQTRLWNARLLPFWYLSLYLLAALGVAELGRTVATLFAKDPDRPSRLATVTTAVLGAFIGITAIAMPLRAMPNSIGIGPLKVELGGVSPSGSYDWLFLSTSDSSFIPSWARWNFSGYEGKPAYPEYHDIVETMDNLGQTQGCGRAMWEHEEQHDRYGTPMALMLLPFWTDGCIGSMEGLFFESSATTPYHFLNQDELSTGPSNAQRELPYRPGAPSAEQFDLGIEHLQMFGVKYYMAISEPMIALGRANPSLKEVASSGPWVVFEVVGTELVTALDNNPAVLTGIDTAHGWLDAIVPWYLDKSQWNVWPSSGGPDDWQRITAGEQPSVVPTTPVAVTNVETGTDSISFDVSRPGTPILVKASYFPNWQVSGADGPWRVGPNLMVVVPTSEQVTLHYGMTPIDYGSWLLTLVAIAALVALARLGTLAMPEPKPWFSRRSTDSAVEVDSADSDSGDGTGRSGDAGRIDAALFDPTSSIIGDDPEQS
jgi:hypothetical protein